MYRARSATITARNAGCPQAVIIGDAMWPPQRRIVQAMAGTWFRPGSPALLAINRPPSSQRPLRIQNPSHAGDCNHAVRGDAATATVAFPALAPFCTVTLAMRESPLRHRRREVLVHPF